jgi:DNA-binding transcriptional MocR family regulator
MPNLKHLKRPCASLPMRPHSPLAVLYAIMSFANGHTVMLDGLRSVGLAPKPANGGVFVWLQLPKTVNPESLFEQSVAQNVLIAPGVSFAAHKSNPRHIDHIRLCCAAQDSVKIKLGCERLGQALTQCVEA